MTSRLAVFAYASLVHRGSAALTLGREPGELAPVRLSGWRRRWSAVRDNLRSEKTFAIEPGGDLPSWALGLNLEPGPGIEAEGNPNGALVEVDETELRRLDERELRYRRVEVTNEIEVRTGRIGHEGFDAVFAYVAKPEHFVPEPPAGAVILAPYLRAVEAGFAALGEREPAIFQATTEAPPVDTVEATLVRGRVRPGNPRDW